MATQLVKYYSKTSTGSWVVRKSQIQDETYGVEGKSIDTSYNTLGYIKNDKLLLGSELLNELNSPIWGTNNNQLFSELIPDFPAKVPEFIQSPTWQWFEFDPDNPETYPKTECPDMSTWYTALNGPRGWECENKKYPGMYYQNMHWMGEESIEIWRVLNIWRYRRQADVGDNPTIPNPEYPIVEEQRQAAFEQYNALVRSTLVPVGRYQFQGLPLNTPTVGYMWVIDTYPTSTTPGRINPDPNHKLANGPGGTGWKRISVPLRNPEIINRNTSAGVIIVDLYSEVYSIKLSNTTWDLSKDAKLTYLAK